MKRKGSQAQAVRKEKIGILVVEDRVREAIVLAASLESCGYHVSDVVLTPPEALVSALRHHPDLILMNGLFAEEANGIGTIERLRVQLNIPVIFLVDPTSHATLSSAVKTNPYGYLVRPYDHVELRLNIEIALFRHLIRKEREKLNIGLQEAMGKLEKQSGIPPVCASCGERRNEAVGQEIESILRGE